ncbi:MAG: MarR family transcriptional regulator [Oscillospiraceae bacterium]|nr:MarR family transcriptional regulator [Oscillospiraceae bacterium]
MLHRYERFSVAIAEIERCRHRLTAAEMEQYGLSSPHAVYLNALYQYEEGLTAVKLGELISRDKADVSRVVGQLAKKGLVRKEATGGNLYRARIKLTREGKAVALHVRERAALAVELAGEGLAEAEREIFYSALERITANLQELSKEGLPKKQD